MRYTISISNTDCWRRLKISKRLYRDRLNIAIFVNRRFTYSPSYRNETNALVRRYSSPYFGMELNFKL